MEEKLNFPVFKKPLPGPPIMSMDAHLKFVRWCLKNVIDRKAYEYWKEKRTVNVRFSLK